jgi:TetR/AcrR family transcriptional repressor of bet genes
MLPQPRGVSPEMPGTKIAEVKRREQIIAAAFAIAKKQGLRAVTVRDVAAKADMSAGLVIFHFGTKDQLLLALLDWVLETTTALNVGPELEAIRDPLDRLISLLRQEMNRLSREPQRMRLFFEFWSEGMWDREIGERMQRELDRYRGAFRPMCAAVLAADPERFKGVTVAGLTAVAVGFIKGCAVQSMIEPQLDVAQFLQAAERLLGVKSESSPTRAAARSRRMSRPKAKPTLQ